MSVVEFGIFISAVLGTKSVPDQFLHTFTVQRQTGTVTNVPRQINSRADYQPARSILCIRKYIQYNSTRTTQLTMVVVIAIVGLLSIVEPPPLAY